jgi:ribonuclease-3 family protein
MEQDPIRWNTDVLAYLGDAVYEAFIRRRLIDAGMLRGDKLHRAAIRYVRAEAQAAAMKELLPSLPEEEEALVKRARNHKSHSRPQHADVLDYKWATAFEALIGYYSLSGAEEKLSETLRKSWDFLTARAAAQAKK